MANFIHDDTHEDDTMSSTNATGTKDSPRDSTLTLDERMANFAKTFPTFMTKAEVIEPWDANALDAWACGPEPSHGMRCTAQFLLAVWDGYHHWQCGSFDLTDALRVWDPAHHKAFLAWVRDPWWP